MNALVEVILPVFLVIGFGYVAARWAGFNEAAVDSLMRFSQNFALPCLLFKTVASIDLAAQAEQGLFLSFYLGAFLCFVIGYLAARHIFDRQPEDSIAIGFAAMFSNSFLLGVPITERAYGAGALAGNFTIIALHGPIFYTFGIMVMEITRSQQAASRTLMLLPQILFAVLRQPLVIGVLSGVVVNLSGLAVPTTLTAALNFIASAAVAPLAAAHPEMTEHLLAGHVSAEPGHARLLARLGLAPLLSLDMRLGEGSGAAVAINIIRSALAAHDGMATFAEAGVSTGG